MTMLHVALVLAVTVPFLCVEPAMSDAGPELTVKTLVAWVAVADLKQQGAGLLTLIDPEERFDSIVLGEIAAARWMPGSDFFHRTHRDQAAWPAETAAPDQLLQIAVVYSDRSVTVVRDGVALATYPVEALQSFGGDAMALIGLRYVGKMGEIGPFLGEVADARIYEQALTPHQIAALRPSVASDPAPAAWWRFDLGKADDVMGRFPVSRLIGSARIERDRLILDGDGFLWAARDARAIVGDDPADDVFDRSEQSLFYKARSRRTGNMWDTWLYRHRGVNYLYYLANARRGWDNISMATSTDGVRWKEAGPILTKRRGVVWMGTGSVWQAPGAGKNRKFIMNYSEWRGPRQTIFFAESRDLVHWERLDDSTEFRQDERWYQRDGRWDCIWTIPRPGGGLYGYWTATPKPATGGRFGFGESLDGVTWTALPPPVVEGAGEGEVGAVEQVDGRYVMLYGTGGRMVTLVADKPHGPFRLAQRNPELLAGHTYFARFYRCGADLLANHHAIARDGAVSMGTLKRASTDTAGALWLVWWQVNDKMKGAPISLKRPAAGPGVALLEPRVDAAAGILLEGNVALRPPGAPPVALWLGHGETGTAIVLEHDGAVSYGRMGLDGSGFTPDNRVARDRAFGGMVRLRLLLKGSLTELYLNDLLMQCYSLPAAGDGRVGLLDAQAFSHVRAWDVPRPDGKPATSGP